MNSLSPLVPLKLIELVELRRFKESICSIIIEIRFNIPQSDSLCYLLISIETLNQFYINKILKLGIEEDLTNDER